MYEKLNSPGRMGSLTIRNRSVMTAARTLLSNEAGDATEDIIAYYEARARGGVGLIITEAVVVDEVHGVSVSKEMFASRDEGIPEFRKMAERIHAHGSKIFAQLFHPGANGDAALSPGGLISASDTPGKKGSGARAATVEEIYEVARAFGRAAARLKAGGFDGVEVHGAHNYLIQSFLSPATNRRQDEFGGNLENRAGILRLIVEEIRRACGPEFPLMVRISLEEYIGRAGYHADTGIKVCQMLESWGVDAISVTAGGTASKLSQSMEPMNYLQGWRKHFMRAVKQTVSIPVCGVSVVREPAFAEELLREGYTDFVGGVRSHLADPHWTNKALTGQEGDIVPCISCMACLEMEYKLDRLTCAMNPEAGYEAQLVPLPQDEAGRLVAVLGGGPGGMEAALVAARRGFRVVLFEKDAAPGGQLRLAGAVPRKEKIQWAIDSLRRRCEEAGVELRFGRAPTVEELAELSPYAIVDATGGVPLVPPSLEIEGGMDNPLVCTPVEVITGAVDIRGESVVVAGSGMTGLETAELLCERERNNAVAVLEAASKIAPGVLGSNRNVVTAVLEVNQVVLMTNRRLTKIGRDRIWFCDTATGEEYVYPCDRVVLALGIRSARPYGDGLGLACQRVIPVGDAEKPGKLWDAIHSGYRAAAAL